jgi:NADH:ubiquinone oxidoreductase subunit 3 (subunit A)
LPQVKSYDLFTSNGCGIGQCPILLSGSVAGGHCSWTGGFPDRGDTFTRPKEGLDKLQNFASGIASHGDARQPMAIKYFLTAILFVLFDVEVIFFYPYAVNFKGLGWEGFWAVLMFVGFFLCGFIYIIKRGALKWEE